MTRWRDKPVAFITGMVIFRSRNPAPLPLSLFKPPPGDDPRKRDTTISISWCHTQSKSIKTVRLIFLMFNFTFGRDLGPLRYHSHVVIPQDTFGEGTGWFGAKMTTTWNRAPGNCTVMESVIVVVTSHEEVGRTWRSGRWFHSRDSELREPLMERKKSLGWEIEKCDGIACAVTMRNEFHLMNVGLAERVVDAKRFFFLFGWGIADLKGGDAVMGCEGLVRYMVNY